MAERVDAALFQYQLAKFVARLPKTNAIRYAVFDQSFEKSKPHLKSDLLSVEPFEFRSALSIHALRFVGFDRGQRTDVLQVASALLQPAHRKEVLGRFDAEHARQFGQSATEEQVRIAEGYIEAGGERE